MFDTHVLDVSHSGNQKFWISADGLFGLSMFSHIVHLNLIVFTLHFVFHTQFGKIQRLRDHFSTLISCRLVLNSSHHHILENEFFLTILTGFEFCVTFVTFFSVYLCCSICVVCVAYLDRITKVADIFGHDSVEKKNK